MARVATSGIRFVFGAARGVEQLAILTGIAGSKRLDIAAEFIKVEWESEYESAGS